MCLKSLIQSKIPQGIRILQEDYYMPFNHPKRGITKNKYQGIRKLRTWKRTEDAPDDSSARTVRSEPQH